jgi:hypothetical protein
MPQALTQAKRLAIAAALTVTAGCQQYTLVPAAKPVVVKDALTVEPGLAWNRITVTASLSDGPVEAWTRNGEKLDMLFFLPGVENGKPLFRKAPNATEDPPVWRTGMAKDEIPPLFESAFTRALSLSVFKYKTIKPHSVAGVPGLRMEFTFAGGDQVDREGVAVAAERDGKLYLVAFQGPKLLHEAQYAAEVERIMASLRLNQKG